MYRVGWSLTNIDAAEDHIHVTLGLTCSPFLSLLRYWTSDWGHLVPQLCWSGQFLDKIQPLHQQPLVIAPITQSQVESLWSHFLWGWLFEAILVFSKSWRNDLLSFGRPYPLNVFIYPVAISCLPSLCFILFNIFFLIVLSTACCHLQLVYMYIVKIYLHQKPEFFPLSSSL